MRRGDYGRSPLSLLLEWLVTIVIVVWLIRMALCYHAPARAEDPPPSPVPAALVQGDVETIELMPIAFTQLRISLFPWTKGASR